MDHQQPAEVDSPLQSYNLPKLQFEVPRDSAGHLRMELLSLESNLVPILRILSKQFVTTADTALFGSAVERVEKVQGAFNDTTELVGALLSEQSDVFSDDGLRGYEEARCRFVNNVLSAAKNLLVESIERITAAASTAKESSSPNENVESASVPTPEVLRGDAQTSPRKSLLAGETPRKRDENTQWKIELLRESLADWKHAMKGLTPEIVLELIERNQQLEEENSYLYQKAFKVDASMSGRAMRAATLLSGVSTSQDRVRRLLRKNFRLERIVETLESDICSSHDVDFDKLQQSSAVTMQQAVCTAVTMKIDPDDELFGLAEISIPTVGLPQEIRLQFEQEIETLQSERRDQRERLLEEQARKILEALKKPAVEHFDAISEALVRSCDEASGNQHLPPVRRLIEKLLEARSLVGRSRDALTATMGNIMFSSQEAASKWAKVLERRKRPTSYTPISRSVSPRSSIIDPPREGGSAMPSARESRSATPQIKFELEGGSKEPDRPRSRSIPEQLQPILLSAAPQAANATPQVSSTSTAAQRTPAAAATPVGARADVVVVVPQAETAHTVSSAPDVERSNEPVQSTKSAAHEAASSPAKKQGGAKPRRPADSGRRHPEKKQRTTSNPLTPRAAAEAAGDDSEPADAADQHLDVTRCEILGEVIDDGLPSGQQSDGKEEQQAARVPAIALKSNANFAATSAIKRESLGVRVCTSTASTQTDGDIKQHISEDCAVMQSASDVEKPLMDRGPSTTPTAYLTAATMTDDESRKETKSVLVLAQPTVSHASTLTLPQKEPRRANAAVQTKSTEATKSTTKGTQRTPSVSPAQRAITPQKQKPSPKCSTLEIPGPKSPGGQIEPWNGNIQCSTCGAGLALQCPRCSLSNTEGLQEIIEASLKVGAAKESMKHRRAQANMRILSAEMVLKDDQSPRRRPTFSPSVEAMLERARRMKAVWIARREKMEAENHAEAKELYQRLEFALYGHSHDPKVTTPSFERILARARADLPCASDRPKLQLNEPPVGVQGVSLGKCATPPPQDTRDDDEKNFSGLTIPVDGSFSIVPTHRESPEIRPRTHQSLVRTGFTALPASRGSHRVASLAPNVLHGSSIRSSLHGDVVRLFHEQHQSAADERTILERARAAKTQRGDWSATVNASTRLTPSRARDRIPSRASLPALPPLNTKRGLENCLDLMLELDLK